MRKLTTYLYIYRKIRNKLDPASNEKPLFCFVFVFKQQNGCNNSTAEVTHDAIELKMFAWISPTQKLNLACRPSTPD